MRKILIAVLLLISPVIALAQVPVDPNTFFGGGGLTIKPVDYLLTVVNVPDYAILKLQRNLQFEGIWTSSGPIITGQGNLKVGPAITGGGFSVGASLKVSGKGTVGGIEGSVSLSYQISYQVSLVKINDNTYIVQLTWTKVMENGTNLSGVASVGIIRHGQPGLQSLYDAVGNAINADNSTPTVRPIASRPSIQVPIAIPYEYGYQSTDGKYYTIAGTTIGMLKLPTWSYVNSLTDINTVSFDGDDIEGTDECQVLMNSCQALQMAQKKFLEQFET